MDPSLTRPPAILPAAGRSLRMGRSKPLLRIGDTDFIGALVRILGSPEIGVGRILVVHRMDDDALAARLGELALEASPSAVVMPVQVSGEGDMLASLRAGWARVSEAPGALVWPVDSPCAARATVAAVIAAARQAPGSVARPVHAGRAGHPVWVPAGMLGAPGPAGAAPGLRGLIDAALPDLSEVPVVDPGCLLNLNTPEDLEAALGGFGRVR